MLIRKAKTEDIAAVGQIYEDIHTEEEAGRVTIGWQRGIYPTERTAEAALERGDLFVMEDNGTIVGAALINAIQVGVYSNAPWQFEAADSEVSVLHTLVISPKAGRKGYGESFVRFYEEHSKAVGRPYLRIDTNERNTRARAMYKKLGYTEIATVPCVFNGIEGVGLVLLEKKL